MSYRRLQALIAYAALLLPATEAGAKSSINMAPGVTEISHLVYNMHQFMLWAVSIIGALVFGVMFLSIFLHRKSRGHKAAHFHENLKVEILWIVIPVCILVAMAVPATNTLLKMEDTSSADIRIQITGYQWKWHYKYLDEGIEFFSNLSTPQDQIQNLTAKGENYLLEVDNRLVIPTGKKVRFLVGSKDVIHSWWVPDFAVKRDAIPGFINESWTRVDVPGIYRGQCTELCGVNHGFMPVVVEVLAQADYEDWLSTRKAEKMAALAASAGTYTRDELMKRGEAVYARTCTACHQISGQGLPPVFPALAGSSITTGPQSRHIQIVLSGVEGTAMQAFGPQLDDLDLAAVITFERNAWGNDTGDMAQPADIKAARQ